MLPSTGSPSPSTNPNGIRRPSPSQLLRKTWPALLVLSGFWYSQTLIFTILSYIDLFCATRPIGEPCLDAERVRQILITANVSTVIWFVLAFLMWLGWPWHEKVRPKLGAFLDRVTFQLFVQTPS